MILIREEMNIGTANDNVPFTSAYFIQISDRALLSTTFFGEMKKSKIAEKKIEVINICINMYIFWWKSPTFFAQ